MESLYDELCDEYRSLMNQKGRGLSAEMEGCKNNLIVYKNNITVFVNHLICFGNNTMSFRKNTAGFHPTICSSQLAEVQKK